MSTLTVGGGGGRKLLHSVSRNIKFGEDVSKKFWNGLGSEY
jgi:hypothetical protein